MCDFLITTTFENRKRLSNKLREHYPNRVPIFLYTISKKISVERSKFLCPEDITVGNFLKEIRKYISGINETIAIFLFVRDSSSSKNGGTLLPNGFMLSYIYSKYKHDDDFLYIIVATESCMG